MKILVPARGLGDGVAQQTHIIGMDGIQVRFARWDSEYYLDIVQSGYSKDGPERAFYPLYPILVAGLKLILGIQDLWSGLIVSTLCFAAACLLLYRWIAIDYSPEVAGWAVLWLCAFPMSFFYIAVYAESLLLLTSIAALYFARRGNFMASGICIALAGATRSYAFLLAVPYIVEFFYQGKFDRRSWLKFIAGALIAPMGTLAYFLFLAVQADNFNLIAIQRDSVKYWTAFGFRHTWPWVSLIDGIRAALFGTNIPANEFARFSVRGQLFQDLAYALFGMVVSLWAVFHIRPNLSAFLIVSVLFFSINHGPNGYAFWSMPRHIAVLAPIYLALALLTVIIPARLRWLAIAASAVLLAFLSLWFVRGGWVS